MYDVAVAGGGPGGLSAATAAARGGARVVVLERESAFGIPTRTSGGSFIAPLREAGVPEHLYNPVRHLRFCGPTVAAAVDYDAPVACVLDVRALYQWLAEQAAAAGVDLHLRATVTGCERRPEGLVLTVRGPGGEWRVAARRAVDATGTAAVLAGAVGLHPPFGRRGVGAEVDLAAPAFPADTCVLAVGEQVAPSGYAWAFPYRLGRVRVGVGIIRPDSDRDPRELLDRVRSLPLLRGWLEGAQPIEVHAGIIPAEPLRTAVVRDGVVCVGDAASHASSLVGEGIRYALGAGAAAGAALAEATARSSDDPLHAFERRWNARHRRDLAVAYRLNRLLAGFDDARWDRAVAALASAPPWFVATALASDFRPRHLARLALRHPGLAARLVRAAA